MAFEGNQNNNLATVNYFSHTSPLNKSIFNQYGFAIGGPICGSYSVISETVSIARPLQDGADLRF